MSEYRLPGPDEVMEIIRQLAEDYGIKVLVFKTSEEMHELLDDMRMGAKVKAHIKKYNLELKKQYLT